MDLGVMIWLILVGLCSSHIHALSKRSFCKAAPRRSKWKVVDMDFLMDFHYPIAVERTEQIAPLNHPPIGGFDQVPAYLYSLTTEHPMMNGIVNSERRVSSIPRTLKDQLPTEKCIIRTRKERDCLSTIRIRKTRQTPSHLDRRKAQKNYNGNFWRKRHTLKKRFFVSRNLHHRPKSRRFKVDRFGNISWMPWHCNGHIVNMTYVLKKKVRDVLFFLESMIRKRDVGNRRLKLSDILTRAGFKKDKEEAIKVVLPLLLSDLKETPFKIASPVAVPSTENIQIPIISSSSGKQGRELRNFKIKGDDGKEFSFSASASDVKQLMDILSKPNSSVVLERVSLDKNRSLLKNEKNRSSGNIKTPNINQKPKEAAITSDGATMTEKTPQLKEFENSVYESILQMDVPQTLSKSTIATSSPDTTKSTEATTNSDTTGS